MTPKQRKLLSFIKLYQGSHDGVSPSFEEMSLALGSRSKSGVFRALQCLEGEGYIRRLRNRARAIEVVQNPHIPDQLAAHSTEALVREANRRGLVVGHIHSHEGHRRFLEIRA